MGVNRLRRKSRKQRFAVCLQDPFIYNISGIKTPLGKIIALAVYVPFSSAFLYVRTLRIIPRRVDFLFRSKISAKSLVNIFNASIEAEQILAEALYHVRVVISNRAGDIDFLLMHRRDIHQALRLATAPAEFRRELLKHRAERINAKLRQIQDSVCIRSDQERAVELLVNASRVIPSDRGVRRIPCFRLYTA